MARTAHRPRGIAQRARPGTGRRRPISPLVALVFALVSTSAAAQVAEAALPPPHEAELLAAIESDDPILRGEAAIGLGLSGAPQYVDSIRAVAADRRHPDAQLRGMIGLALSEAAGVEVMLGDALLDGSPRRPEAIVAAWCLGYLSDEHPTPAIDTFLERFDGGSWRRHRDALAALVTGLGTRAHPSRVRVLRDLLGDESNRLEILHYLSIRAIARVEGGLTPGNITDLLDDGSQLAQRAVLEEMGRQNFAPRPGDLARIEELAADGDDPGLRSAALEILVDERSPASLELAAAGLRASDPREIMASTRAVLRLGGGSLRAALERRILAQRRESTQCAMLDAWSGPASESFVGTCRAVAAGTDAGPAVRIAAAHLVANAGDARIAPTLRTLLGVADTVRDVTRITQHLGTFAADDTIPAIVYPADVDPEPASFAKLPMRLEGLFRAGHPTAMPLLIRALNDDRFASRDRAQLLRAWRVTQLPKLPDGNDGALPRVLRELLESART